MVLTRTPDPNRSTAISFVHVDSRPLYIVDWRMVVVKGGNVKREGELSGRGMSWGICYMSRGNVRRIPRVDRGGRKGWGVRKERKRKRRDGERKGKGRGKGGFDLVTCKNSRKKSATQELTGAGIPQAIRTVLHFFSQVSAACRRNCGAVRCVALRRGKFTRLWKPRVIVRMSMRCCGRR